MSRYHQGHAREHWANTDHCYCLELKTQRVWDYVGAAIQPTKAISSGLIALCSTPVNRESWASIER